MHLQQNVFVHQSNRPWAFQRWAWGLWTWYMWSHTYIQHHTQHIRLTGARPKTTFQAINTQLLTSPISITQDEAYKRRKHKDRSVLCERQVNQSLWKAIWALMAAEGSGFLKRNEKWQYVNVTAGSSEPSGSWLRARPTERDTCTFPSKSLYFPAWDVSESLRRRTEVMRRSRTWKEFKYIPAITYSTRRLLGDCRREVKEIQWQTDISTHFLLTYRYILGNNVSGYANGNYLWMCIGIISV